jgi:hypothetical protein
MGLRVRVLAATVTLTFVLGGPLALPVSAQQAVMPPVETEAQAASAEQPVTQPAQAEAQIQPAPPAPAPAQSAPPQMFKEELKTGAKREGVDIYDVGAVAATAFGLPLKAVICGVASAFGIVIFAATFGSQPAATTRIFEEGCAQKWIVKGDDIRPAPPVSKAFEWETHRFDWEPR